MIEIPKGHYAPPMPTDTGARSQDLAHILLGSRRLAHDICAAKADDSPRTVELAGYQIVMGVVVSTMVKQLEAGCAQWIMLYQNWAV